MTMRCRARAIDLWNGLLADWTEPEIATLIAGSKWSGPAFFGFRESRR